MRSAAAAASNFPFTVAAKTGTSQAYHDNWTIGYTRSVTVGVWVGNFDRRPLIGSSGVTGAGPIFHAVMLAAEQHVNGTLPAEDESATVAQADHTSRHRICALSGMAATPWCPTEIDEWTASEAPLHDCTWHQLTPEGIVVVWPAEYQSWARAERLVDRVTPAPSVPRAIAERTMPHQPPDSARLRIVSPPDGALYLIDPTLKRDFQTLPLRVTGGVRAAINWRVDGQSVAVSEARSTVDWPLVPGRHRITAQDPDGHQAEVSVVVK